MRRAVTGLVLVWSETRSEKSEWSIPCKIIIPPSDCGSHEKLRTDMSIVLSNLYSPKVNEALEFIGTWTESWNKAPPGPDRRKLIHCSYRNGKSLGKIELEPDTWALAFDELHIWQQDERYLRVCAGLHLHVKSLREDYAKSNGLPLSMVDNFTLDHFKTLPANSKGCRETSSNVSLVKVCPDYMELHASGSKCHAVQLLLSHQLINTAEVAWNLSVSMEPFCIDPQLPSPGLVSAERISDGHVGREGNKRTLRVTFLCGDRESTWSGYTFDKRYVCANEEPKFTVDELIEAQERADSFCSQTHQYVKSNELLQAVVFGVPDIKV
jgi:hypothetical protein